ncbi:MAG: ribosomal large subunit pseudouridine synthase B [Bacteroidales bacterium]|nr:ribosomal large subunit pseudouridine synthase B [Bacteroidales bacterium]
MATTTIWAIMESLDYTSKSINLNFRIKVSGVDDQGRKINKLVGVSGLIALIGEDIALINRLLKRAFNCLKDACICKLRRGLKVTFYNK